MSVTPIEEMNYKELRSEVRRLRDEVSKMKRFYEDLFYNLDTVNFSPRLVRENKNLRTVVELTAEGLKTKVSASDVDKQIDSKYSQFEQTAESISSEVTNIEKKLTSQIEQTSESIKSKVSENDFYSLFEQTADGFTFDGEKTKFSGVIYLTDGNLKDKFSIWCGDDGFGNEIMVLHSVATDDAGKSYTVPIIIGSGKNPTGHNFDTDVFIGQASTGNEVATRGWVRENNTAGFG